MNELLNIDNFSLTFCSDQKFSDGHRIAIARAIILQPKLLILGEPAPTRLWPPFRGEAPLLQLTH